MSFNNFTILKQIGEGAYSTVYKVQRISDGKIYALKKVRVARLSKREVQNALNEIRILASVKHPNVIAYKEAFYDESTRSLW